MDKLTIIYIAGYGRSGSTLLERILSSHEKIVGVGELSIFLTLANNEDFLCACGEPISKCRFWSGVINSLESNCHDVSRSRSIQLRFEAFSSIGRYILWHNFNEKVEYKKLIQKILRSISHELSDQFEYIVDSSKTSHECFFRPIALSRIASVNVKVIHLVRDGRGCMYSVLKGSNRKMEKGQTPHVPFAALRAAMGWLIANIAAHIFQVTHPSQNYCRIRYQDFIDNSAGSLAKLGDFLGISFDKQVEMLKNEQDIPPLHQIGGNRLRFRKKIILKKDIQWKTKLKTRHKLLFFVLNWPLALIYKDK